MKFGRVDNPGEIDFTLPKDDTRTNGILKASKTKSKPKIFIGCAKWNRQDLKGFYPRGTKDELTYYSSQFNCIELNATFYRIFPPEQVAKWYDKTPDDFVFYPKIPQSISQFKRLKNVDHQLDAYFESIAEFKEKLGIVFLQMHPTFAPKSMDDLVRFIESWPKDVRLSLEVRHRDWYADKNVNEELCDLLTQNNITHILSDTAGRRDMVHMCLTTPYTFIRYTGANHESDYSRLDDWFDRLKSWIAKGVQEINFFVHQNLEVESPLLSAHLIKRLNKELGYNLTVPEIGKDEAPPQLF